MVIYKEIETPIFLPLSGQMLSDLTICIKNQYHEIVKFLHGPIIIQLQIKPSRLVN